jgi:hypothetical protein
MSPISASNDRREESAAEVRPAEVRPAEVRAATVRLPEVRPAEVRLDEGLVGEESAAEVRADVGALITPRIPSVHALLEQCDVLVVRHQHPGVTRSSRLGGVAAVLRFHAQIAHEPVEAPLVAVVLLPAGKVADVALAAQ